MWQIQRYFLSFWSRDVIRVSLQTLIIYLRIVTFRNLALSISSWNCLKSSFRYPPAFNQITTASLHCQRCRARFKAFPTGALREFDFQESRIPELHFAPQIILQLHPVQLHPTLLSAKPLAKFPTSLIVMSNSPQFLTEVNFFSPSINRNQQVKKFCLMWHWGCGIYSHARMAQ